MAAKHMSSVPSLPSHLSYKSALVLLPPTSITSPIERLRARHDRQFQRWPPHINLIYPFLSRPGANFEEQIRPRLEKVLENLSMGTKQSFEIELARTGIFWHGKRSATVWVGVGGRASKNARSSRAEDSMTGEIGGGESEDGGLRQLKTLQRALQTEFAECDADDREWTPHLTLGQAKGDEAGLKVNEIESEAAREFKDAETDQAGSCLLPWFVDRVCVLERGGYKDRFKVVVEVALGGSSTHTH